MTRAGQDQLTQVIFKMAERDITNISPVISPLVKDLSSDQLMEIADDVDVFAKFYGEMVNHQSYPYPDTPGGYPMSTSTPIRPPRNMLRPLSFSPLLLIQSERQEQGLRLKKYLMVILCHRQGIVTYLHYSAVYMHFD